MMWRTFDTSAVRELWGVDATEHVKNESNIVLLSDEGGMFFRDNGGGLYDAHIHCKVKGRPAINMAKDMIDSMFDLYDANIIVADVPLDSRNVRMFARQVGMKSHGIQIPFGVEVFSIERAE